MTRLHDPEAPDPPVADLGTADLGAMLRESRVALGRELEDVAAELRIRQVYLQAIEDGRLDDLPGIAYATGFLRAYGDLLGLDGHDLVRRFKAAGMAINRATDLHLPSPVEEGRLPTGSVLLVAALLAFGAYGGWYYISSQGRDPIENVSALPDRLAELVGIDAGGGQDADAPGPATAGPDAASDGADTVAAATSMIASATDGATDGAAEAATETTTPNSEPVAVIAATDDSSPPAPVASATPTDDAASAARSEATPPAPAEAPPPAPTEEVASAAPPEPPAPPRRKPVIESREPAPRPAISVAPVAPVAAPDTAPAAATIVAAATRGEPGADADAPNAASAAAPPVTHRVVLRATTATWVEVGAAEKVPLLSRMMRRGETFVVPAVPGLMMATGNAGAIEILVDGRALPRLGTVGEIRRNVALDAESLLATSNATR